MKKFFNRGIMLLASALTIASCTNEAEEMRPQGTRALDIQVAVKPTSRAQVIGTSLPEGAQIGVNVTATDGSEYDGQNVGYLNVPYTATGTGTTQTWGATNPVMLSGTEGKMYAYYPYTAGVDYTAVSVDITDQHDWMYGTEAYSVSDKTPSADVVLTHAQTALNINVVRDDAYTGTGLVETLAITSEGLASEGTLDTRDGSWSSVNGANTAISIISAPFTLASAAANQENPYMFVPATDETKDFTVTATVDGKAYNVGVAMNEAFAPGKMYQLNVKVTNTGLTVSKVTLIDWNIDTTLPEGTLQPEQGTAQDPYADWVKLSYKVEDATQPVDIFSTDEYNGTKSFDVANVVDMMVAEQGSRATGEPQVVTPAYQYTFSTTGTHTVYVKFTDMTAIPDYAFLYCPDITSITIPNSVTRIGKQCCFQCEELKTVNIPNSVEIIDYSAFQQSMKLSGVIIPESVTTIGDYAFYCCYGITGTLTIPESVTRIGDFAFSSCKNLGKVVIGSNVTYIGDYAFNFCESLKDANIPNSVQRIGKYAFYECKELTGALVIPESVTSIGWSAFQGCAKLTSIDMRARVQTIDMCMFYGCSSVTEITISETVEKIESGAFDYCTNLTSFTSLASTAPTFNYFIFNNIHEGGTLYVPDGASGYDAWMRTDEGCLGYYNWTIQEITGE